MSLDDRGSGVDHAALRRLTAGRGDPDQRAADATALGEDGDGSRRVVRALVQALWDDEPVVRDAAESALERQFRSTDEAGRRMLVNVLFVTLAGDADPPRAVTSFLFRLVGWVRSNRTTEPDLFATVLTEAERAREGGSYSQPVSRALKQLYNAGTNDESRSTELLGSFNRRRALDQLRSETAPPGEVEYALRLLGDRPVGDASLEVLLYHLLPLRIAHDYQVMNKAVGNLNQWSDELPQSDRFELANAVEEVRAFRRGDREALPGRLRNEIALSEVGVDVLVSELDRLRDLAQYERVVPSVLDTLSGVHGVREHADALAAVAAENDGRQRSRAVDVLSGVLTGLDAEIDHNRDRIRASYDDDVAETDDRVRELFAELAGASTLPEADLRRVVRELVRSRPQDATDRIAELIAGRPADDPVVETVLDTVASESILDGTAPIVDLFERLADEDPEGALRAAETLKALGHDDARRALENAMAAEGGRVADGAREALVTGGFYERVRAVETRSRSTELAARSESAEADRVDAEADRREARSEYKRLEGRLREEVFEADQALRRGLADVIEQRIDSLDTLVELHVADRRVERLLEAARSRHGELGQYVDRVVLDEDVRGGIREEFETIEHDLTYLERLSAGDGDRAAELDERLEDLDAGSRVESDVDSADDEHRTALLERERESLRELRDRYRTAADERSARVSELRSAFERERRRFDAASVDDVATVTSVQDAIDAVERRASEVESLVQRREREWERVTNAVDRRDESVSKALASLEDTVGELERAQRRIDDLTREISDRRLDQQHSSQRSKDEKETYGEIEPRARGDARHRHEVATDRASFYEHRQVYEAFIRRYYETQLDVVRDRDFRDRHADQLARIRDELTDHME